jgi:hypothetical protein
MSNVFLGWNNRIDAATLSGGSWVATLPLANLKNRTLAKLARSTDDAVASTKFDIDLGAPRFVRLVALVNHNISLAGLVRLRGSDDAAFATTVHDSGWVEAWPVVYPLGSFVWGDPRTWTGKYTAEEIAGYTLTLPLLVPAATLARYWRVEIDDTANPAGYLQLGRVMIADGWQPAHNMSYGASHAWETDTEVQRAKSGAEYFDRRAPRRVARFSLDWMGEDEAFANAFEIQHQMGIDMEVFLLHNPADTVHLLRRAFLGRLRQLSPIEYPYYQINKTAFEIQELL